MKLQKGLIVIAEKMNLNTVETMPKEKNLCRETACSHFLKIQICGQRHIILYDFDRFFCFKLLFLANIQTDNIK